MADRHPRPSTDQEAAPLLQDPDADAEEQSIQPENPTFAERLNGIAQEPLTLLTKILLILVLVLLIISAVFIGLFAGVQHKLNVERGRHDHHPLPPPVTTTLTATRTTTTSTTTTNKWTIIPPTPTKKPDEPACLSPDCIILSASILSSLDTSQDPCENFYEYANGGWLKAHPLPADKGSFGNFEQLAQDNGHVIQAILENSGGTSLLSSSDDKGILKKLRGLYNSCLKEDRLDEIGQKPLLDFLRTLKDLYRRKKVEVSTKEKKDGLTEAVAFLHSRGVGALFGFEIEGDVGVDPNYMILWFNQPELGLPSKEYYEDEDIRRVYQEVLEKLLLAADDGDDEDESLFPLTEQKSASLVQQDKENSWPPWPWPPWGEDGDEDDGPKKPVNHTKRVRKLAKGVLEFETRVARASLDLEILQGDPIATYNPAPISKLTEALPQIHFDDYFSTFASRTYPERVILTYPPFATSLSDILNDTSSDVIEAYLIAQAALSLSPYLGMNTDAWKAQRTLVEALTGVKKGAVGDRAEYCVKQVEETLGFAAGRYFVNETFSGESKEKGTKVITDIVRAFEKSLRKIDWMDGKSAKAAAEKAESIRVKVGYPISPDTNKASSIALYYRLVKIDNDKFFENMISAFVSEETRKWLQLGRARDPESWEMYPSMVNAYFNPPANEIVFPAGILQPPFFHKDWPSYLSYGAFGHVASHELTHAFDSAGRLYNQEGKLEYEGFQKKQDCIVKQYSEYSIDDGKGGRVHVNGNLTSGENIGDTGLIQAYRAWEAQYESSYKAGKEYLLPGLDKYTREQLFFISFARVWARSMKPAAAVQRIRTDPHSPSIFRVDGTVFNIPQFAEAFKCSKKAKLNPPPEKRCIFWG
ncbi:zincin [Marasmius fiardii PR-910]|nr:zincin [Marasmius fiardii PR-910]